jgi:glucose/arabinose dehydrogenase
MDGYSSPRSAGYGWLLLLLLLAAGLATACGPSEDTNATGVAALSTPTVTEVAQPAQTTVPAPSATAGKPVALASPAEEPAEPPAPTALPTVATSPTPDVYPTATAAPLTPTPDAPPAAHVDVEQAPYAESECSDKYPCNDDAAGWEARMRVPPGFEVDYFARVDDLPTSLTFGPDGNLYVAAYSGTIYQVDQEGRVTEFFSGLTVPTGIAFQPGTDKLFVSSRVTDANVNGEGKVSIIEDGQETTLFDGLPCCYVAMHGPNGIAFGPDGYGYVGVGGRADHGEILLEENQGQQDQRQPLEASILRFAPDGSLLETYARGFRNPYDIAWDAQGQLYATDNGRDGNPAAGDIPPDELNRVIPGGEYGYPWFDCPVCFSAPAGVDIIPPLFELPPHAAATGITAYLYDQFPGYYDDLFLVLWSAFEGAQSLLRVDAGRQAVSVFATGFAQPIDVTAGPDGSLYVADFATGIIFRISYVG